MKRPPREAIVAGDVYVPEAEARYSHRRVVAVLRGMLAYSVGSDTTHYCKLDTFAAFMRGARKVHAGAL